MRRSLPILVLLVLSTAGPAGADQRGVGVSLRIGSRDVPLYAESYALVIGASTYTAEWPSLPEVRRDVALVKEALALQGFTVRVVIDPTRLQFEETVKGFIADYGQQLDARLLIYFAGHGHTLTTADGRQLGYIVPTDAPHPSRSVGQFKRFAVSMTDIETIAVQIESKHVLFVFDSCFSGSIFNVTRAVPDVISEKTARPVRQFITAGSAEQTVPDKSVFREQFVEGISGEADANGDGYITGSELGEFLQTNVTNYTRRAQTPEYGKLSRPGLDKGDFVFDVRRRNIGPAPAVIVRGRGIEITRSEYEAANRLLFEYSFKKPIEVAAAYARIRLLAARGRAVGLGTDEESKQRLQARIDNLVGAAMARRIEAEEVAALEKDSAPARAYYDSHRDEFTEIHLRGIAVALKGSSLAQPGKPELTAAEAAAKAERLRNEILAGADFATVARRESDDPESAAHGGLGDDPIGFEDLDDPIAKVAFAARVGTVLPIVRVEDEGYAILRVDRRTLKPFPTVRREIILKEAARRAETRIATMVAKTNVTVTNAEFVAHARNLPESERSQIEDPKLFPRFMESVKRNITLARAGYAAGIDRELTLSTELRVLADEFVADAERDQMKRGIVITERELNDYYREHQVDFESARTRQVWIHLQGSPWGPGRPKWTEAEARLKAERLHNGLLAGGSFEKLAAAEGIDEVFDYVVTRGQGLREFENAIFGTSAGSVAPVVRTEEGYHVIRVDSRTIPPFDTVKSKIDEILRAKKLQTLLDALVASAELQYDRMYFASR